MLFVTFALSLFCAIDAVICSMEALVSSMPAACSLAACASVCEVVLTCSDALASCEAAPFTSLMIIESLSTVSFAYSFISANEP